MLYIPSDLQCDFVSLHLGSNAAAVHVEGRDEWQSLVLRASAPAALNIEIIVHNLLPKRGFLYTASLEVSTSKASVASDDVMLRYEVVTCDRLASLIDGVEVETIADAISMPLAPIEFGTREKPEGLIVEYPEGGWDDTEIAWEPMRKYCLPDAVVHGDEGLVTVGPYILEESIRLASFRPEELVWTAIGSGVVRLRTVVPKLSIDTAASFFSGYPGGRNYAHWMVDILPAAAPPLVDDDAVMLWPDIETSFRKETLAILACQHRSVFLSNGVAVKCRRLRINPFSYVDAGHFPHPARMDFVEDMRRRAEPNREAQRLIYVSRRDGGGRNLRNEDEIAALVESRGFEILTLSSLPVIEQVRTFAEASIVVGAHGAGLTNIMFCRPQTMLLELLPDLYIQWMMRRLASIVPLRYGCVIGQADEQKEFQQDLSWRVDPKSVAVALDAMLAARFAVR